MHQSDARPYERPSERPSGGIEPEVIHARYAARIRRRVQAVLGADEDRDDLVQEVLLTAVRKIDTVRDPSCLDAWVAKVTSNTLKYFLRRRRLRRHSAFDELGERQVPAAHSDVEARDLAVRAMRALSRLPERERVLLETYWFTPATAKTLAAEIGCSSITLRRRLTRARLRFEKLARQDPALASRFDDSRSWWRRWHFEDSEDSQDSEDVEDSHVETRDEDVELDDFESDQTPTAA